MNHALELQNAIEALVRDRVREYEERGIKLHLSLSFPEQLTVYDHVTKHILYSLEISAEMDVETKKEWMKEIQERPNLVHSLIREQLEK
jgi:hypothetical protein